MAVQLANALSERVELSALCCTRKAGPLKTEINTNVKYIEINKKHALDVFALVRLRKFVKTHQIKIIHAHGSSFFIASVLKLFTPQLKLVWHDHYGLTRTNKLTSSESILTVCSLLFNQVLVVKKELKDWGLKHLKCRKIELMQNFSTFSPHKGQKESSALKGSNDALKIIHVANFRPQKDHLTGLKAIQLLKKNNVNVTYHLFGNFDERDAYYTMLKKFIDANGLRDVVFTYGAKPNISDYLRLADIGILTSTSEGLPLSLIEYALAKLPVVVSNAGECKALVGDFAKVFEPQDYKGLYKHINKLTSNFEQSNLNAKKLYHKVSKTYGQDAVVSKLIEIYGNL